MIRDYNAKHPCFAGESTIDMALNLAWVFHYLAATRDEHPAQPQSQHPYPSVAALEASRRRWL